MAALKMLVFIYAVQYYIMLIYNMYHIEKYKNNAMYKLAS